MIPELLIFGAGLAALLVSSDRLVKAFSAAARGVGLLSVTILVLSMLASMPELTISVLSAAGGKSELSLGTVLGSNIFTLLVVLGLPAMVRPYKIRMVAEERDSSWMIFSSALLLILAADGEISKLDGAILVLAYAPYLYTVSKGVRGPGGAKVRWGRLLPTPLLIALALLGAEGVVRGGTGLAVEAGMPPYVLSILMFGIGSSLPETAIGLISARRGKTESLLGDVYGTNIFTVLVITGISAMIEPIDVNASLVLGKVLPMMLFASALTHLFISNDRMISKAEGSIMVASYALFVYLIFT